MHILTTNGYRPLISLSNPKLEPIAWPTFTGPHTLEERNALLSSRKDYEQDQLFTLLTLRQRCIDSYQHG